LSISDRLQAAIYPNSSVGSRNALLYGGPPDEADLSCPDSRVRWHAETQDFKKLSFRGLRVQFG